MIRRIFRQWVPPVVSVLWVLVYIALYNLWIGDLLMQLPLPVRMVAAFPAYWLWALVPACFAVKSRYCPFTKEKLPLQILVGLAIAAVLSAVGTVVPHLLGFGEWVSKYSYTRPWQFAYELIYCLFAVALVEEWVFRGFLYHRFRILFRSPWVAIGITSVLFGLVHLGCGNWVQVLVTALLGMIFCLCREKLKHCTTLSLIIAHGVYDWLICLWTFVYS